MCAPFHVTSHAQRYETLFVTVDSHDINLWLLRRFCRAIIRKRTQRNGRIIRLAVNDTVRAKTACKSNLEITTRNDNINVNENERGKMGKLDKFR